jgi:hypothetical protein
MEQKTGSSGRLLRRLALSESRAETGDHCNDKGDGAEPRGIIESHRLLIFAAAVLPTLND